MKLKYYMRGVGVGIIFTAIIFIAIIIPKEKDMSDAEIRTAAKVLGMVEGKEESQDKDLSSVLNPTKNPEKVSSEASTSPEVTSKGNVSPGAIVTPVTTPEVTPTLAATVTPTPPITTPEATPEPTKEITPQQPDELVYITIKIEKGMSSEMISEQARSKGLVSDNEEFNRFLVDQNYADFISIGSFQVPEGTDYRGIATIITGEPE